MARTENPGGKGDWDDNAPIRPTGTWGGGRARPAAPGGGPAPALSPDVAKTLGGLGIDPASIQAALASGADTGEDDPLLWVGDHAAPLSRANMNFYKLTPGQLKAFQGRMQAAGVIKKPRYGDYDEETFDAWRQVNERAARFYQAGKKFTPRDIIDMVTANAPGEDPDEAEMGRPGRPGFVDAVANKVDLEEQIQQAARGRLNRRLNPREVAKFVAVYQGMQKQSFAQQNAAALAADGGEAAPGVDGAPGQSATLVAPVVVDAAANQFLDSGFAQEAAGESAYGYLDALQSMLGGR